MQVSKLIVATRSTIMASTGQTRTQIPQPVQLFSSIFTDIDIDSFLRSGVPFHEK